MKTGTPIIRSFTTKGGFRYLWLKYVTGFDLSVHCARCLLGSYSNYFRAGITGVWQVKLNEAPADYYYLCGVTEPFVWRDNLHLAFRYKQGSTIEYDWRGTHIVIDDAEQIEIQRLQDYSLEPTGKDAAFHTCRNWRFAYQIVHGAGKAKM